MGLFDKVCSAETHLSHPALYATKNTGESSFNIKVLYFFMSSVLFDIIFLYYILDIICTGILDMDCKCFNTFISSLLVITIGSKRRNSMGKWPRWWLYCFRKFCIHSMY